MSARIHPRSEISAEAAHVFEETEDFDIWKEASHYLQKHGGQSGPGRALVIVIALDKLTGKPTPEGTYVQPPRAYAKRRAS